MRTEIQNHFVSHLSIALQREAIEHRRAHIGFEKYSISKD